MGIGAVCGEGVKENHEGYFETEVRFDFDGPGTPGSARRTARLNGVVVWLLKQGVVLRLGVGHPQTQEKGALAST